MKPNDDGPDGATMNCEQVEELSLIERYIAEKLPEAEAEAFERHYLGCQRCFAGLQMRHAAAIELSRLSPAPKPRNLFGWVPRWAWGLAPAALAAALLVFVYLRPETPAPPSPPQLTERPDAAAVVIRQLAAIEPAPYIPGIIRGDTSQAIQAFQTGMQEYNSGQYQQAAETLAKAIRLDSRLKPAIFYLGVTYLLTDRTDDAIAQLSELRSDPNYTEDCHWYLAKAYLRQNNVSLATAQLETVVGLNGSRAAQARQDLERLRSVTRGATR